MMLKNAPISPPEEVEACSVPAIQTPHKDRSILFTSTPRSILRNIPRPALELADTTLKTLQTGAKQHAHVYLIASRSVCHFRSTIFATNLRSFQTLSNSLNISLITALFELLYLLHQVTPWNFKEVWTSHSPVSLANLLLDSYSARRGRWQLATRDPLSSPRDLPVLRVLECSSPLVNTHSDYPCTSRLPHFIPPRELPLCTCPARASCRPSHGVHLASCSPVRLPVQSSRCYNQRHRRYWISLADPQRCCLRCFCIRRSYLCRAKRVRRVSCALERRYAPTNSDSRRVTSQSICSPLSRI